MPRFGSGRLPGAFRSLVTRLSFFVFAATLTSTFLVAYTSAQALRGFLRAKVEQKIPAEAAQMRDRLDLWYAQRSLDVQVFARSAVVADGLARGARAGAALAPRDREEIERYLRYVLEGFPQYASILVLDPSGRLLAEAGRDAGLAADSLAALAALDAEAVSEVLSTSAGRAQAVSAVVSARDHHRVATLHALLRVSALEETLAAAAADSARALVFDGKGALVAASQPLAPHEAGSSLPLDDVEPGVVRDYLAHDGLRVVGSARPFGRFGWTLVVEESYAATFGPIASILGRTVALNLAIVLVLSALAFAIVASLVRPLHALSACARRLRDGEKDVDLPEVERADEVGILARSFAEMVGSLRLANETLEQLAITDGLTKIHNHRFFQDQLSKEIKRSERGGQPLALVLLDIDDFKQLNDRHGHAVGDGILEGLAALLVEETRGHDLVARYGGEEFAILAPDTDLEGAVVLAEKLRLAVSEHGFPVVPAPEPISITISVGVAVHRGDREAFFRDADRALYEAKAQGKDCVVAADGQAGSPPRDAASAQRAAGGRSSSG